MSRIRIAPLQGTSPAEIQQWARQLSQQVETALSGIVADEIRSDGVDDHWRLGALRLNVSTAGRR